MPNSAGFLVTFEGLGGCGKSTVVQRLVAWLQEANVPTIQTREPGGTPLGERLRAVLLQKETIPVPWAEVFLFEADRAQTYAEIIVPALRDGNVVVSDRNYYGTIAYQAFGRNLNVDLVDAMSRVAMGGVEPALVFVLDVDPAVGLRRKYGQLTADRFDDEGLAYQQRVREGYLFAARRDPEHAHVIDAGESPDAVFAAVRHAVADHLGNRLPTSVRDIPE